MKAYRVFLVLVLVIAIVCGIWYCISSYNEQRSDKDGILVWDEYAIQWNIEQSGDE